jgi:uncharacterized protein
MEEQHAKSNTEMTDSVQSTNSARPARIAILEGGGMRGYITAHFLLKLEQYAGQRLCELFDLVVGTSTGGILAALIVSEVAAAEMVEFYEKDGPKIFKRSHWWALKTFFSSTGSKYGNQALIKCLETRIPITKTVGKAKTDFMVPTWNGNADENIFIKSYDEYWKTFPLAYAAVATASAPTFFPGFEPQKHGQEDKYNSRFFDGGFIENNPVTCTLHEIYADLPEPRAFQRKPRVIVNFGTGSVPRNDRQVPQNGKGAPNGGWLPWATQIYPRMAALQSKLSERTAQHMFGDGEYIRIDGELDVPIKLDDARPDTLKKMKELAGKAIEKDGHVFDRLVNLLKV